MKNVPVWVRRLPHSEGLPLPVYATAGAAGMDVFAALDQPYTLEVGERALIPTGLQVAICPGYELQIRPRSGLALKFGVMVANAPGTIDEDYRGEVKVILHNAGNGPFVISRGDRIAQVVLSARPRAALIEVVSLPETQRGEGGFGSTG